MNNSAGRLSQSSPLPSFPALSWLLLLPALCWLTGCRPPSDVSDGAQLLLSTEQLTAGSTFELRFDSDVAAPDAIGHAATPAPLTVTPALRGTFIWQSRRSGVFTPGEPMALGRMYQFALRAGLRDAAGVPVTARLMRTFTTLPFSVAASPAGYVDAGNLPVSPAMRVVLNAAVDAKEFPRHVEYRSGAQRIAARLDVPAPGPGGALPPPIPVIAAPGEMTWREQFEWMRHPARAGAESDPGIQNVFVVTPVTPLPAGTNWELVVSHRLASVETPSRLQDDFHLPLGRVLPFELVDAEAVNEVNLGRRLVLSFSKPPYAGRPATNFVEWIRCQPQPDDLRIELEGSRLVLRGGFQLGTNYSVQVLPGLPADEPVTLAAGLVRDLVFTPISPRLYFPAFDLTQLSSGRREFELLAVNAGVVRLRAKALDRHTLIHALRAYRSSIRHFDEETGGMAPGTRLDYGVIPGHSIAELMLSAKGEVDQTRRVTLDWDEILGPRRHGGVFLAADFFDPESNHATNGPRALLQLTDLGLAWKLSRDETLVWVFSQATARPMTNTIVRLATEENEFVAEARTDEAGLARLPRSVKASWLLAETDDDLHAQQLYENELSRWAFRVPEDWRSDLRERTSVMLFSDRSVYRPGETLQLKALARDWADSGWAVPATREAKLRGIDVRGDVFLETNVVFSARGSLDLALPLPEGPRGGYQLELSRGEEHWDHEFQVRDFKPNAFQVLLDAKREFAADEEFVVPVRARYFLGRDLARARVHWTLEASETAFAAKGWEEFHFGNQVGNAELGFGTPSFVDGGDAELREGTNLVLGASFTFDERTPGRRQANLRVEVTDLNQQTISASDAFTLDGSDFYLGARLPSTMPRAGEALRFGLVAVRADGMSEPQSVSATAKLHRVEWQTIRVEEAGHGVGYRSEAVVTNVATFAAATRLARQRGVRWGLADEDDLVTTPVIATAGQYVLELRARDRSGHEAVTMLMLYVAGTERLAWNYRNELHLDLVPDRPGYRAGEVAEVLVKTPINGTALVTVERERVLRSFVTNLVGNMPVLRVPLEPGDAPNIFVGVTLVRGQADSPKKFKMPEDRAGYCTLLVQRDEDRLEVEVRPNAGEYRPGQPVEATATVRDSRARPVVGAEVTLYAVDEGVASLGGDEVPDPFAFFNQVRGLGVTTHNSLPNLLPEDPSELSFQNKGTLVGGGGKDSARPRKKFLPLACWAGALITDQSGIVRARFMAPDSLTRYRLVAVAHDGGRRFGSGHDGFEVNKPLMIEPALPRFANVGDHLDARAIVLNQTEAAMELEVALELDATSRLASPSGSSTGDAKEMDKGDANVARRRTSRPLKLAAHGTAAVDVPVEFGDAGAATWTWSVRQLGTAIPFTDSVQSTLAVGWPAPLAREVRLVQAGPGETNLLAGADPKLLEGRGRIVVRVSNSRLNELGECVDQLLHYPYGCVEQTSSSLLPWVTLRGSPLLKKSAAESETVINAGVRRLFSMQVQYGGLSYWPGSNQPQFWGSAYAGLVLTLARERGVPVPEKRFEELLGFLSTRLRGLAQTGPDGLSERCLAVYTLARAGKPEAAYHELLFRQREQMTTEERALLALAVAQAHGPAEMIRELLHPSRPAPDRPGWFDSAARETAVRLLAALAVDPAAPEIGRLVADLIGQARQSHWGTTQGNAWALFALSEYAATVEQDVAGGVGVLEVSGSGVPFELPARGSTFEHELAFNARQIPTLNLRSHGSRPLYVQVVTEARSTAPGLAAAIDRGFSVQRTYERLDEQNRPQPAERLRVGDRILITLQFRAAQAGSWVAIEDPLPAIFEAVTPSFKTDQTGGAALARDWVSDFHELRHDRALFFRDELPAGSAQIRYLARVRAAGEVTAPSAKIETMYQPERFGLSGATRIKAEAAE